MSDPQHPRARPGQPVVVKREHGNREAEPVAIPCPRCFAPMRGNRCTGHGAHEIGVPLERDGGGV